MWVKVGPISKWVGPKSENNMKPVSPVYYSMPGLLLHTLIPYSASNHITTPEKEDMHHLLIADIMSNSGPKLSFNYNIGTMVYCTHHAKK